MEIIIGIVVIALVAYVLTRKKDVVEANEEVPYKVEVAPVVNDATDPVVEAVVEVAPVAEAPAKKARAKKPAAPKAPRAKKAPKA